MKPQPPQDTATKVKPSGKFFSVQEAMSQGDRKVDRLDETYVPTREPAEILEMGIACCQRGDWKTGFEHLSSLVDSQREAGQLPSRYYSYLGYGMALQEKRFDEGIKLCRYAIKREFYQTENYVNLARTCLLAGKRRMAWKAVEKGLSIDAQNKELLEIHATLGVRQPPVLPFLSRQNVLNRMLGSLRR